MPCFFTEYKGEYMNAIVNPESTQLQNLHNIDALKQNQRQATKGYTFITEKQVNTLFKSVSSENGENIQVQNESYTVDILKLNKIERIEHLIHLIKCIYIYSDSGLLFTQIKLEGGTQFWTHSDSIARKLLAMCIAAELITEIQEGDSLMYVRNKAKISKMELQRLKKVKNTCYY